MTWCIAFPYCPNEQIRADAFDIVAQFYATHFPKIPQITHSATKRGEKFLRAKTRNELVTIAERCGYDVVALIDADTLVDPETLRVLVEKAHKRDMFLGKPFLKGVNLPIDTQRALAAGTRRWPRAKFNDPGAAWVIRPESWWAAGGMDEALTGWGADDSTFSYLFSALGGETEHGQLPAVKTEHDALRWRNDPDWPETIKRELVTKAIWQTRPDLAGEWIKVRHERGAVDKWVKRLKVEVPERHLLKSQSASLPTTHAAHKHST